MSRSLALVLIAFTVTWAVPASAKSLRQAVQEAVQNHPSIAASLAARDASAWDTKAAQSRLLPVIDLSGNIGPSITDQPQGFAPNVNDEWMLQREVSLTIRQVLFDGGDRSNDIRRTAALTDSLTYQAADQAERIALDAVEVYIDVRRFSNILNLARENRKRLTSTLGLVRERTAGGTSPQSDLEQARERVAGATTIEKQVEQALEEAKARYRAVIGSEPVNLERAGFPKGIPDSRSAAIATALKDNPSIRALGLEIQAADYAVAQAESGNMPTLSLEGIGSLGEDVGGTPGKMNSLTGQLSVQWNLYQGMGTTYRTRALKERASKAIMELRAKERQIQETVEKAFAAYAVGRERVAATRSQAQSQKKVLDAYQAEYKGGKRTLLDLLDAQNATFTSQFQLASAEAVNIFAAYQLLSAMNRLLSTMGLGEVPRLGPNLLEQSKQSIFSIDIEPLR